MAFSLYISVPILLMEDLMQKTIIYTADFPAEYQITNARGALAVQGNRASKCHRSASNLLK
jgi:hypothetical protein